MPGTISHASVGTQVSQAEWESSATHLISGVAGVIVLTSGDIDNTAYAASWSGVNLVAPSKGAVYAQIETLTSVSGASPSSGAVAALQAVSGICVMSAQVAALKAVSGSVYGHKATHQNGGSDALNVSGLTGLLATAQTPAAHNHIVNMGLANGTWDGRTISGVVAQLVSATQVLYQKASGYGDLADADAEVTAGGMLVMATAGIASAAGGVLLEEGLIRNDSGFGGSLAIGLSGTYFVGTTPGALLVKASAPAGAGDIVREAGYGLCADVPRLFNFLPATTYFEHS